MTNDLVRTAIRSCARAALYRFDAKSLSVQAREGAKNGEESNKFRKHIDGFSLKSWGSVVEWGQLTTG